MLLKSHKRWWQIWSFLSISVTNIQKLSPTLNFNGRFLYHIGYISISGNTTKKEKRAREYSCPKMGPRNIFWSSIRFGRFRNTYTSWSKSCSSCNVRQWFRKSLWDKIEFKNKSSIEVKIEARTSEIINTENSNSSKRVTI